MTHPFRLSFYSSPLWSLFFPTFSLQSSLSLNIIIVVLPRFLFSPFNTSFVVCCFVYPSIARPSSLPLILLLPPLYSRTILFFFFPFLLLSQKRQPITAHCSILQHTSTYASYHQTLPLSRGLFFSLFLILQLLFPLCAPSSAQSNREALFSLYPLSIQPVLSSKGNKKPRPKKIFPSLFVYFFAPFCRHNAPREFEQGDSQSDPLCWVFMFDGCSF